MPDPPLASDQPRAEWPDIAGRLIEADGRKTHRLAVRVYYEDTDFSGVAYHGSYVRWCERGRSDFLRLAGNDHRHLLDGSDGRPPAALMVRRLSLDYLASARIDDLLEVVTSVKQLTAATLVLDQRVKRRDDAVGAIDLVRAEVTIVLVTMAGRVLRIDRALGRAFGG